MHNNYYFLRQISSRLNKRLDGLRLLECYTQNRNELVLAFGKGEDVKFYIVATLTETFSALTFPKALHRANRNSTDIFPNIISSELVSVEQIVNDRSFVIHFKKKNKLLFKLHGNRSNIIYYHGQSTPLLFKGKLKKDAEIDIKKLSKHPDQSFEAFRESGGDYRQLYPTFDRIFEKYMRQEGYFDLDPKAQYDFLQKMEKQLKSPEAYYIINADDKVRLTLLPIGAVIEKHNDPFDAANAFKANYFQITGLEKLKAAALKELNLRLKRAENYVAKNMQRLEDIDKGLTPDQKADIIMANLHSINPREKKAKLYDFYNDTQVEIALKPDLSPQKNAENYYRKAKNQRKETDKLLENIRAKQQQAEDLKKLKEELEPVNDLKTLKRVAEDLLPSDKAKPLAEKDELFKNFSHMGYTILVGKNAKNNDVLTQRRAKKNDLWLHAKDVTGSHVVVVQKGNEKFPMPVIERAAELAAYYSKRKTDSLCPVTYTPKKYVRKKKGAPPGQVIVEREAVIMVKPAQKAE